MTELRFTNEENPREWEEVMEFFDYYGGWNEDGDYSSIMD